MEAPIYFIFTKSVGLETTIYEDLEKAKEVVDDLKKLAAYRHQAVQILEVFPSNTIYQGECVWEVVTPRV